MTSFICFSILRIIIINILINNIQIFFYFKNYLYNYRLMWWLSIFLKNNNFIIWSLLAYKTYLVEHLLPLGYFVILILRIYIYFHSFIMYNCLLMFLRKKNPPFAKSRTFYSHFSLSFFFFWSYSHVSLEVWMLRANEGKETILGWFRNTYKGPMFIKKPLLSMWTLAKLGRRIKIQY